MKLSDLSGKEVINLSNGSRLGNIADCDLLFDNHTGKIHSLLLPNHNSMFPIFNNLRILSIPWNCIKKIGNEIIIVDLHHSEEHISQM